MHSEIPDAVEGCGSNINARDKSLVKSLLCDPLPVRLNGKYFRTQLRRESMQWLSYCENIRRQIAENMHLLS